MICDHAGVQQQQGVPFPLVFYCPIEGVTAILITVADTADSVAFYGKSIAQ